MTNLPKDNDPYAHIRAEGERLLAIQQRAFEDPARFFLDEWNEAQGLSVANESPDQWLDISNLWFESLEAWAESHGALRLASHSDPAYSDAQHEWGVYRLGSFGVLELGYQLIQTALNPTELIARFSEGTNIRPGEHVRKIANHFADAWAVTEGEEIAALALVTRLGRTDVTAFALASGPDFPYRLNGKSLFHITGDPEATSLDTYMKRVRQWVSAMAGIEIRGPGGQLATFETLQDMSEAYARYRDSLPEGTRPKQWEFALRNGLTDSAIRKRLATLGATWADVTRGK